MSPARVSGTCARYGTRTYVLRRITEGTGSETFAECSSVPPGSPWTTSALPHITSTTARRSGNAVSGSKVASAGASTSNVNGPESDGPNRKRQFVAVVQLPGTDAIWFFRFVGPYDGVTQGKPAFESFVKSLKFDEK